MASSIFLGGHMWLISQPGSYLRYVGDISALGTPIKMLISQVFVVGNR